MRVGNYWHDDAHYRLSESPVPQHTTSHTHGDRQAGRVVCSIYIHADLVADGPGFKPGIGYSLSNRFGTDRVSLEAKRKEPVEGVDQLSLI
jgi:hypothetical protein